MHRLRLCGVGLQKCLARITQHIHRTRSRPSPTLSPIPLAIHRYFRMSDAKMTQLALISMRPHSSCNAGIFNSLESLRLMWSCPLSPAPLSGNAKCSVTATTSHTPHPATMHPMVTNIRLPFGCPQPGVPADMPGSPAALLAGGNHQPNLPCDAVDSSATGND